MCVCSVCLCLCGLVLVCPCACVIVCVCVCVPFQADYSELKEYLRAGLTAHFVDHFDDVYRLAFDEERKGG